MSLRVWCWVALPVLLCRPLAATAQDPKDPGTAELEKFRDEVRKLQKLVLEREVMVRTLEAELKVQQARAELAEKDRQAEVKRLQQELIRTQKELIERLGKGQQGEKSTQEDILKLRQESARLQEELRAERVMREAIQRRTEQLLATLREREVELARLKGGAPAGEPRPKDRNPPPAQVKGIVLKVDANDKSLVQVSLGRDAGLRVGHTLEVYRLQPQPLYLGTLRVVEATESSAVGRLLRAGAGRPALQEGDRVVSSITGELDKDGAPK